MTNLYAVNVVLPDDGKAEVESSIGAKGNFGGDFEVVQAINDCGVTLLVSATDDDEAAASAYQNALHLYGDLGWIVDDVQEAVITQEVGR